MSALLPLTRLDHYRAGHMRMQGTKIRTGAWCCECERELVVGVERLRFEDPRFRSDHMRNVVAIGPDHGGVGRG